MSWLPESDWRKGRGPGGLEAGGRGGAGGAPPAAGERDSNGGGEEMMGDVEGASLVGDDSRTGVR